MKNVLWMLFILNTFGSPVKSDTKAAVTIAAKAAVTIADKAADIKETAMNIADTTPKSDTKAITMTVTDTKAAETIAPDNKVAVSTVPDTGTAVAIEENTKAAVTTLPDTTDAVVIEENTKPAVNTVPDIRATVAIEENTKAAVTTLPDTKAAFVIEEISKPAVTTVPDPKSAVVIEENTKAALNNVQDSISAVTTETKTKSADIYDDEDDTKATAVTVADTEELGTTVEDSTVAGINVGYRYAAGTDYDDVFGNKVDNKAGSTIEAGTKATTTSVSGIKSTANTVEDIDTEDTNDEELTVWPREVFCSDYASLFHVFADQSVSSSIEGRLQIYRFEDGKLLLDMHPHFKYPIIPSISPALLSEDKQTVMLPDLEQRDAAIGIELPEDTIKIFFQLIHDPPQNSIEDSIVTKAETIAAKLLRKAEKWRGAMNKKTAAILQAGPPAPPDNHPIIRKGAQLTKTASEKVMQVTKFGADMVTDAVEKVGVTVRHETPNAQGTELYEEEITSGESNSDIYNSSNNFNSSHKKKSNVDEAVVEILATTHVNQAWGKIYVALEKASQILAKSIRENTVKVIRHKYGKDVGEAVKDLITSAKNGFQVRKHIKSMKADKVTGRTLKRVFMGPSKKKTKKPPGPGECNDEL